MMNANKMTIIELIKFKGLKVSAVAQEMECSRSVIYNASNNPMAMTVETLVFLKHIIGCEYEDLIYLTDK